MAKQIKLYGVSTGDGNNGVSHAFPDYYVRTDNPWRLAECAAIDSFKPGAGMAWAKHHLEIDGESEFTISATLYNPACNDTPDGEYPEMEDSEDAEDGRNWSEHNGAWFILEVFPETEPRDGKQVYESIEDAFRAEALALVPAD